MDVLFSALGRVPLYLRVLAGVAVGVLVGAAFGTSPWLGGLTSADLGPLGMLVVRALKTLATPLIFVAIVDSFLKTNLSGASGARLLAVCALNVTVAMVLGLVILNLFEPGLTWRDHLAELQSVAGAAPPAPKGATLSPLQNFAAFIPENLVDPFQKNLVISIVLVAVLVGAALRSVRDHAHGTLVEGLAVVERLVEVAYATLTTMLLWVAEAMPVGVALIVADVVGKSGVEVFLVLWTFFLTVLAGLCIHALGWYPLVGWALGRMSPARYLRGALDPVVTALSCNSSLATMPVTLRALAGLGVHERAARLSACVGTNFNNDGIMLYEAMATLFLCQALGMELSLSAQLGVVAASIMAGVGIAGIPEAGLIILPLVLGAAGVPEATVAIVIPLIVPVDWILARVRSGVNVLADMVVAIVIDRWEARPDAAPPNAA